MTETKLPDLVWAADDHVIRTVQVKYPFVAAQNSTTTLSLTCRRFVTNDKSILEDVWQGEGGAELVLTFPPVACVRFACPVAFSIVQG